MAMTLRADDEGHLDIEQIAQRRVTRTN